MDQTSDYKNKAYSQHLIKLNRIPAAVGGIDQCELTALRQDNFRISKIEKNSTI